MPFSPIRDFSCACLVLLVCCWPLDVSGQTDATTAVSSEPAPTATDGEAGCDSLSTQGNSWLPLPIIFYTPETQTGFGGMLMRVFRAPGCDLDSRASSLTLISIYTTRKQILTFLPFDIYWFFEVS